MNVDIPIVQIRVVEGNFITSPPDSGAYPVGATILLQCGVDTLAADILGWYEFQTTRVGRIICDALSNGTTACDVARYPRYDLQVDAANLMYTLVIRDALLSDGGYYKCSFANSLIPPYSAVATIIIVG